MDTYTGASDGELAAAQQAIQAEVQRRERLSQAARAEQFRAELQEIRDGNALSGMSTSVS